MPNVPQPSGHTWYALAVYSPKSSAAYTNSYTELNHITRAGLPRAGYSSELEQLWDAIPTARNDGLQADLFVLGREELLDCFVDVAVTCPMELSFSPQAQSQQETAAARIFQEKIHVHKRKIGGKSAATTGLTARSCFSGMGGIRFLSSPVAFVAMTRATPHSLRIRGLAQRVVFDSLVSHGLRVQTRFTSAVMFGSKVGSHCRLCHEFITFPIFF